MATTSMQFGQSTINVVLNEGQLPAKLSTDAFGNTVLMGADGIIRDTNRIKIPDQAAMSVPIVLEKFDGVGETYTFSTDGTGAMTAQQSEYQYLGTSGLKMTAPSGTYSSVTRTFSSAVQVGSGAIGLFLKWAGDQGVGVQLYLSNDTGWTNYAVASITGRVAVPRGWLLIQWAQSNFTLNGSFSWASGVRMYRVTIGVSATYPEIGLGGLVANIKSIPLITFSCDDGYSSQRRVAAPILAKYGYSATAYIFTGKIGNTPTYCTSTELLELQNNYGWAIANHGRGHLNYSTLTSTQMESDFNSGVSDLIAIGANAPYHFAYPYGVSTAGVDGSDPANVLTAIGMLTGRLGAQTPYRGFQMYGQIADPGFVNPTRIKAQQIGGVSGTITNVKAAIDQAILLNENINLFFHKILDTLNPSGLNGGNPADGNEFYRDDFEEIVAYVKQKEIVGSARVVGNINDLYSIAKGTGRFLL